VAIVGAKGEGYGANPESPKTGIRFTQVAAICSMAVPKLDSRDHNM
jgi:hypothetical protein